MPKIIIIRGNSGSGKTTVAKELQHRFGHGTMLISHDVVRREIMHVKDMPGNPAIDLIQTLVLFARAHCALAILEGILNVDRYGKVFQTIAEIYADNIYAYYFDLPFEETLKRHSQKPNSADFGETEMRRWWKEKEFLPNITEKILDEKMSKNFIIDLIYSEAR